MWVTKRIKCGLQEDKVGYKEDKVWVTKKIKHVVKQKCRYTNIEISESLCLNVYSSCWL